MSSYCLKLLLAISLFVIQTQCKGNNPIKDLGHNLHNYPIARDSPNFNKGQSHIDPNISDDETIPITYSNENSESKEVSKHLFYLIRIIQLK